MPTKNKDFLGASFRDPSGFLFSRGGILYRQVNRAYADDFSRLTESGLYEKLVKAGLLIPHTEVDEKPAEPALSFRIIRPERVPFISYPYEWSFSQLKDAALATLSIQRRALKAGMSLKDASAYNIQFVNGKPILIDTLSFETYQEGKPWDAYRQFCQHFLVPLALMSHVDIRLGQLLRVYIDGIPLDLASRLLPASTRLNFGLLTHIHIHASAQTRYADADVKSSAPKGGVSRNAFIGLIESLEGAVKKLTWKPAGTEWGNYYEITNYTDTAFTHKKEIISGWLKDVAPASVWDLGANNGEFSRLASTLGIPTVAWDIDPSAVEQDYLRIRSEKEQSLLPLVLDLTNPSPALGWANEERDSLGQRGPVDMVFALALIHHLAISNNVPLTRLADFFAGLCRWLVIEWVPKTDSQVQKLLRTRKDIFDGYTREGLESAFGTRFHIRASVDVNQSERRMYLLETKR
ncbi:MAG: SAM-dependent methyltransferase [Chloroflexota bacterium]